MKVRDIIARYEDFCSPHLSMEGDVCGLQLGSLDQEVTKVMVCLDVREQTVAEAIEQGADLLIVKHAPIFRPLKDLVSSPQRDILLQLVKHDIAVYVSHTNIDVVSGGLNDWFCDLLGIEETEVLSETKEGQGIGRIGQIAEQSLADFARKVKAVFDLDSVRLVTYGDGSDLISRVAICGGSGESFYPAALEKGAQVYITGDIYYHTAQDMLTQGLSAIDPGHHIEVLFVERLVNLLQTWQVAEGWSVTIIPSQRSTNPFRHL